MKKAIITGPTGAVGMALIDQLVSHGIQVTVICRPDSKRLGNIPKHSLINLIACSLDKLKNLHGTLSRDFDVFYHLGWTGTYGEERRDILTQERNIIYTLDAVRLAHELNCSVFIGAGSQSEFGHVEGVMHPDLPCNPDNGYGAAKLSAGIMSRILCKEINIRHIWCRIFSVYGPYDNENTMIMSSIRTMLMGKRTRFTEGNQVWDYIYSKDAAEAFCLAAKYGRNGAIYCLGSGKTRRLKDYIMVMRDAIDPTLDIGLGELEYYPNQVMHLEADISSLTRDTGFVPSVDFETGIKETIDWYKRRKYEED